MGAFASRNQFPVDGRTVIVTGASQGMGRSVARLLAQKGANVILVARNIKRLEEAREHALAGAIQKSQRFHYISADLSSSTEAARVVSETTSWNNESPPDIIWCCAGAAFPSLFIDTPISKFESQHQVNYLSAAYIAHAALNLWLKPSSSKTQDSPSPTSDSPIPPPRHIIFTSSVLALYPIVGYSPYTPSKSALRALTDTLSQELHLYPARPDRPAVIPHCIFPATILSPGHVAENETKPAVTLKLEASDTGQSPEEVAAASIRELERGDEMITTELFGELMWRAGMGSSRKSGWGLWDTIVGWVVLVVFGWVRWDMDRTVKKWGKEEEKGREKETKTKTKT